MRIHQWQSLDREQQNRVLQRPTYEIGEQRRLQVEDIIARVRAEGDAALADYTRRFDRVEVATLKVGDEEFAAAEARLTPEAIGALERAIAQIRRFHAAQLTAEIDLETSSGVRCQRVRRPLSAVGLYVPAGSAPLPSTAMMLAVPAELAGVGQRVLCTPPAPDGGADPAVLVAARRCGVTEVFKVGGAQAVAAMAYGTESIPKVDKIFGPGNSWVTAAKEAVSRDPMGAAREMPAGPSEVLVIADDEADAAFVASDLLSQAEHGPDSQVLLFTPSAAFAQDVYEEVQRQTTQLDRADTVRQALENSSIVVVDDIAQAIEISNRYAPEHLILQVREPRAWLDAVTHAGSVFLGPWTPESMGDYCSGTNHVLPTYGFARSYSGLSVGDFLRHMTVQEITREGLADLGPVAQTLATLEGLDAHARAVSLRLEKLRLSKLSVGKPSQERDS